MKTTTTTTKKQTKKKTKENDSRLCDTKKKFEQGSFINKTKTSRVKVNVLLINSL